MRALIRSAARFAACLSTILVVTATIPVQAVQCVDIFAGRGATTLSVRSLPASLHARMLDPVVHTTGESGLMAKIKVIEKARPGDRIDLAYFIYEADFSSSYLTRLLIQKANQGVKIRIVIDYFMAHPFKDLYRYLQSHANIEVFLFRPPSPQFVGFLRNDLQIQDPDSFFVGLMTFNKDLILQSFASSPLIAPMLGSSQTLLGQFMQQRQAGGTLNPEAIPAASREATVLLLQALSSGINQNTMAIFRSHLVEFTRRLHHKIIMSGNDRSIEFAAGGRNLSDEYHLSLGHTLLAGRSYPFFDTEVSGRLSGRDAVAMSGTFERLLGRDSLILKVSDLPPMTAQELQTFGATINTRADQFATHLPGVIQIADRGSLRPRSGVDIAYSENLPRARASQKDIVGSLEALFRAAESEITIISAYAHITPQMLALAREAASRGVKIKLYTNSFTSTDMNIVNIASYMQFANWSRLLGNSLEIYELQLGAGQGSLHSKTIFVDGKIIGIGSANFDPRSDRLDTNNFVFFDATRDPLLASRVIGAYVAPENRTARQFSFDLPWARVDQAYVDRMLTAIQARSPALLRAVQMPDIINQL